MGSERPSLGVVIVVVVVVVLGLITAGGLCAQKKEHTTAVAVGDLDVLFGNHKDPKGRGGDNTLLLNDGKGSFSPGSLPKDRTSTSVLLLADRDGDRFPEILQGILSSRGGRTKQLGN